MSAYREKHSFSNINELESYLNNNLVEIRPRPEFVTTLHSRLTKSSLKSSSLTKTIRYTIFAIIGIVITAVVIISGVWTAARLVKKIKSSQTM